MIIDAEWVANNGPVRLYSATGQEIYHATWADTKTGEVVQLRTRGGAFVLDEKTQMVSKRKRMYAAPLKVHFIYEGRGKVT